MKIPKVRLGKKTVLVSSVIVLGLLGGVSAQVFNDPPVKATDSPLVKEVEEQGTQLDNHEARITNTESDVKDLQNKTGTPPSVVKVPVPVVVNQPSQSTSAQPNTPAPVTVTAYREIVIDPDTSDCEYTYSDGTTHMFRWKTTNPQGSWVQTGGVGAGHWETTVNYNNDCNQKSIGRIKV